MFFSDSTDRKKDIEMLISTHCDPKNCGKLASNIFDMLQTLKKAIGESSDFEEFKIFFKRCDSQESLVGFIEENYEYFVEVLSKLCSSLNKSKLKESDSDPKTIKEPLLKVASELFKVVNQYAEARELSFKKADWVGSFALLDELEKDNASVLGVSLATASNSFQVIPSWALELQTGTSLSLHSVDPIVGCSPPALVRAKKLGVTLKEGEGSQKAESTDENVKINLHQSKVPLYIYSKTPISEAFFQKLKKILSDKLKRGNTVILGYHGAGTYIDPMIVRLFNELKKEQSGCQLILHVQGGKSKSIYYQEPVDFEGHHEHFYKDDNPHLNDANVYLSCIVDQFPALKQSPIDYKSFAESSICDKEKPPSFLTSKAVASPTTSDSTKPSAK